MRQTILFLIAMISVNQLYSQGEDKQNNPYLDLTKIKIQKNSGLFRIDTIDNEQVIMLQGNEYNSEIDPFTGMEKDNSRGAKVILLGDVQGDYVMTVEMKFLDINLDDCPGCGWFGYAIRAQDYDNFETVWFMPGGVDGSNTVAYMPIAHGVGPYWAEAYKKSEKGNVILPKNDWFKTKVVVEGKDISIYVDDILVLKKKASYYLTTGTPGLFVGTATDAAFRRIKIKGIGEKCNDNPENPSEIILRKEKDALKRWVNRDIWGYLDLYAEDVTYFDETTNEKIKGYESIKNYYAPWDGKIYVPKYEMFNVDVKVIDNTGILTYNLYNFNENGDTTVIWNSSEIYQKINGDWKIVHSHWSAVK